MPSGNELSSECSTAIIKSQIYHRQTEKENFTMINVKKILPVTYLFSKF
jgi:hypothetical protein